MPLYSTYISFSLCLFHFEQHITKMLPIIVYTHLQLCLPCHVFCRWNFLQIVNFRSSTVHGLVLYAFVLRHPPKEIIRGREIRQMFRPWNLTTQRNDMLQTHFLNNLHGQLHHLAGTICSRAQFHYDSVLEWGSSINISTWKADVTVTACPSSSSNK
jgi:hypothetical protein